MADDRLLSGLVHLIVKNDGAQFCSNR